MGSACCSQAPSSKDDTEFVLGGEVSNALAPPSNDDAEFERAAAVSDAVDKDLSVPTADAPATAAAASEQAAAAPVASAAADPAAASGWSASVAAAPATSATGLSEHCSADAAPVAVQAEAAPPAEASPAPPAEPAKVDFSGHWLLTATDDMTDVMNEKKVGWAMRAAAKAAGYGVGKVEQVIKQTGDHFVIETKAAKNFTQQFIADGKEALVPNSDGVDSLTTVFWEHGNTVMVMVSKNKDGSSAGSLRRYMDGDKYVMTIVTPKGIKCRRIFSRK